MTSGRNIFHLNRSRAHGAQFPAISQVEGYWHGLCQGLALPYRCDIDPKGMETSLAFSFILQRIAPEIYRFRIAGQHLNELMGFDIRGMPISAMFSVQSRKEIGRIVETVCAERCIKQVFMNGGKSSGRGALSGKMFLAPLLDDTGEVSRIRFCRKVFSGLNRAAFRKFMQPSWQTV